jgi:hypothetical protein
MLKYCDGFKTFFKIFELIYVRNVKTKTKLRGFSPQANYTDRATAACRRS